MPARRLDLVTAGESFDDIVFYGLSGLPGPGQEFRTPNFLRSPGGGAIITAVAAARLGLRCGVVSGLSIDSARLLRDEKIAIRNLRVDREPAAVTVALSTRADRRFVTFDGVNRLLGPRIRKAVPQMSARHVHFALVPRPCRPWISLVRNLRRRGISTSWDFGWDDRLASDPHLPVLATTVDYLFLNRDEALMYSRTTRLTKALERWRRAGNYIVIKLGSSGSRLLGSADRVDIHARGKPVRAVDSTGAGDAFNGGFLAARLRGKTLDAALALGNRIGALSTRRAGGIAGLPQHGARI
jgi:sugar/nucleoside kinase (ribokinase family)